MNPRINATIALMVICLLAYMVGCADPADQSVKSGNDPVKTRTITDDLGREVQIPDQLQRVLALNSSMMETLFDLGVVPIGKVVEYEIDRPEAANLPSISNENSPDIEKINELAPDLIIAHARNHAQIMDSLEGTGAAVVFIDPSKAEDQLLGRIDLIGEILNRQTEAAAYTREVEAKAGLLREKVASSPINSALLIQGGSQNIMAAQSFCFWGRLLSYLGVENIVPDEVAKTSKAGFVTFDIETIILKDPDAILILQPGFRSASNEGNASNDGSGKKKGQNNSSLKPGAESMSQEELLAMYREDPMWQGLSAVENNRIYIVPINVSPGKINIKDALEVIAQILAPEAF